MLSWRATMIAGKDLINQFKAASWKHPDEIDAFIGSVEAPDTSELLKILDIVSAKAAEGNQHRARLVVFGRLIDMNPDKALFGPFVKALKGAEPALRSTLAALLPKVNSPTDHAGLVDHLRSSDTGLRATVARALQQLGGTRTLYDLLTRAAGEPSAAGRAPGRHAGGKDPRSETSGERGVDGEGPRRGAQGAGPAARRTEGAGAGSDPSHPLLLGA